MGSLSCLFLTTNIFLISILLWLITFVGFKTNNIVFNKVSSTVYECGFKNTNINEFNVFLNSVLSLVFLVLYEIEFILTITFFFNKSTIIILSTTIPFLFLVLFITFFLDTKLDSIKWVY